MKKIASVMICLVMVLSLLPFTVSAADEINFALRIEEETEKEVTLVLDYDGGVGFSALDIDITFDRIRLDLKSCEKGDGYAAFEKYLESNSHASICSVNSKENPIRVSMANTLGFKAIDGEKSVVKMKFAKVPGTKFAKEDVTFDFTNCQTASFTDIKVNFEYDLAAPVENADNQNSSEDTTEYPQQTSADNANESDDDIKDDVKDESQESDGNTITTGATDETDDSDKKPAVIIAVAAVCVAGIGVAVFMIIKKKKH